MTILLFVSCDDFCALQSISVCAIPAVFFSAPVIRQSYAEMLSLKRINNIPRFANRSTRFLSNMLLDFDDDLDRWPRSKSNTFVNVCPQGCMMVIERLGKLHSIQGGGWFIALPGIDKIRFVIDMREKALSISPQSAITKDNVHIHVSGNLYCQFVDAEKAAYGSKNPLYAVKQHAQSSMRAAMGEMELDEILHARAKLNSFIRESVQESAQSWGLEIKRYEITEVSPDRFITEAMDKQAAAERDRRKKVLDAEGNKKSQELESEGMKIRMKNESEGMLIKITNEAEAQKIRTLLEAEGEAAAILATAHAHAEALKTVAEALKSQNAADAAQLAIAREYISMYGRIGATSNTMIFSDRPGDIKSLFAQAASIIQAIPNNSSKDAN
jgi:regulator of protease activity HflC (stomatin/prohibitin superfamily)